MVRTPRFVARVLAAGALVAGLTLVGGPPAGAQAPTVTVTPATGLTDWTYVRVTGSGFEPNALLEYFQCRGGAVDENDCDGYNADYVDADGAGDVDFVVPVDARIWLPDGTEVDCRTDPAGCEIGVGYMLDAGEWPEAALEFDPDAPLRPEVTATVTPATGLVDGQTVAVHAEHVLPRFETWVFQCAGRRRSRQQPAGRPVGTDVPPRQRGAGGGRPGDRDAGPDHRRPRTVRDPVR